MLARISSSSRLALFNETGVGKVIVSQTQDVPAIDASGNAAFQVQAIGANIAAWRYKAGS